MNKKVLIFTIALLMLVMTATPMVGTAQACRFRHRRTKEPYHADYVMNMIQPPTVEIKGDYRIYKGAVSQGDYVGPLGTGTMTAEMIITVLNTATGKGWAIMKNTLVIASGPYGAGTLVGSSWFKYEGSLAPISGGTFLWGTGDLRGVFIYAEKGYTPISTGVLAVWEDGWITHP